jgi:hypothetical protein
VLDESNLVFLFLLILPLFLLPFLLLHLHSSSTSASSFFLHICFFILLPRFASSLRENKVALARVQTPAIVIIGLYS